MNKINENYEITITNPEEAAGAAFVSVHKLLEKLGIASNDDASMSLKDRILSCGKAVKRAVAKVQGNPKTTYLKGSGITPTDSDFLKAIINLETHGVLKLEDAAQNAKVAELRTQIQPQSSPENMVNFAASVGGVYDGNLEFEYKEQKISLKLQDGVLGKEVRKSPNADWRDILEATLERGTAAKFAARSTYKLAEWNAETPFSVLAMPATVANTKNGIIANGGKLKILLTPNGGGKIEEQNIEVSAGSSFRFFTTSKTAISEFLDAHAGEINSAEKIMHGSKATVIKGFDSSCNIALAEKLHSMGASDKIDGSALSKDSKGNTITKDGGIPVLEPKFLIDNVHERLVNPKTAPKQPTLMISLNQSYGQSVQDFWQKVRENGGFKTPQNSSIIRLSATKDHYKPIEFSGKETGGKIEIKNENGEVLSAFDLQKNETALFTFLDKDRVRQAVSKVFEDAQNGDKKNVLFGFDDNAYYGIARQIVDEIQRTQQYPSVHAEVLNSSEAAAKFFTGEGIKDCYFVASNIMGDFYTDIEFAGKATSYSIGTLPDGRRAIELGTGGTAPDQLDRWKENGILQFSPMALIEGSVYAIKGAAEIMEREGLKEKANLTKKMAESLENGLYKTIDKGIVLPILAGAFRLPEGVQTTKVSAKTFVKSVEMETLRELGKPAETIAKLEGELAKMIAYDTAIFAILASDKADAWKNANKKYNEARENAKTIDPFNPNYDLEIPLDGLEIKDINAENLLKLQEKLGTK